MPGVPSEPGLHIGLGLASSTCLPHVLPGPAPRPEVDAGQKFVVQGAFSSHAGGLAFVDSYIEPMCGNTCMKVPLPALLRYFHS